MCDFWNMSYGDELLHAIETYPMTQKQRRFFSNVARNMKQLIMLHDGDYVLTFKEYLNMYANRNQGEIEDD